MRSLGIVSVAMLSSLSVVLMQGKQDQLGKNAAIYMVLGALVFVLVDHFVAFLKKGAWLDRYSRYAKGWQLLIVVMALPFLMVDLLVRGFGSPFMITMTIFDRTPVLILVIAMLLVGLYMSFLKEDRLMAMGSLLGVIFLAGVVFLFVIGWQMASFTVLPFDKLSYHTINRGLWYYAISMYAPLALLMALVDVKERRSVHLGVLLAGVIGGLTYFGNMYLLDAQQVSLFHFPTVASSSLMSYGHFLQRLELVAVLVILLGDVVRIGVVLRFLYRLVRPLISQKMTQWVVVAVSVGIVMIGQGLFPSFDVWHQMSTMLMFGVGMGFAVVWLVV